MNSGLSSKRTNSLLLMKILQRSDKEKNTFKAIEKYRYGLWKTISKHLNFIIVYDRSVTNAGQVRVHKLSGLLALLKKRWQITF